MCHISLQTACEQEQMLLLASCLQISVTYTTAVCTVKIAVDGQGNCPKHVEFHSKNKLEKLVHLVSFIIRNLNREILNLPCLWRVLNRLENFVYKLPFFRVKKIKY